MQANLTPPDTALACARLGPLAHKTGMTATPLPKPRTPEEKLAAALRANLLKRKQQATERQQKKPLPTNSDQNNLEDC